MLAMRFVRILRDLKYMCRSFTQKLYQTKCRAGGFYYFFGEHVELFYCLI